MPIPDADTLAKRELASVLLRRQLNAIAVGHEHHIQATSAAVAVASGTPPTEETVIED